MTEPRAMTGLERGLRWAVALPAHVGVLLGLSAGAYAAFLAGVTIEQSQVETARIADRAPVVEGLASLTADHDRLGTALDDARAQYEAAAGSYADLGLGIAGLEARIADLSAAVTEIEGAAAALPANAPMPAVAGSVGRVAAPPAHTTTGASGG